MHPPASPRQSRSRREDPHGRRQPAAVHQGRRRLGAAARRARGAAGAHRPALRRLALGGLLHASSASRARPRAGDRRRVEHLADGAHARGAGAAARRGRTRRGARLRGHQLHARGRPGGSAGAASRSCTSRRACARFDRAMPEELNRVADRPPRASCCCAPPTPRPRTCAAESVAGRVEVVGDVMVDVALRWQPGARADARTPETTACSRGDTCS